MSKFKLSGDIRIPKEPIKGVKFSDMQLLYEQIKHRDPAIFIGVKGDRFTATNMMVTSNKDTVEKIVFDISNEGTGLEFTRAKRSIDFMRGFASAILHVRVKDRIHKVIRLVDNGNIIRMDY